MALIAAQQVVLTGLTPVFAAANNADTVTADGRTVLWVVNGSGAPITVTVVTPKTVSGLAVADQAVVIAAGAQALIGPFSRDAFGDANGQAGIDYSATATVTRTAIQV